MISTDFMEIEIFVSNIWKFWDL